MMSESRQIPLADEAQGSAAVGDEAQRYVAGVLLSPHPESNRRMF